MDPMEITPSSDGIAMSLDDNGKIPPLLAMPIEILVRISSHLTTKHLFSLRLTCRGIEQAIFNTFADEFFSRKQFMICEFSLNGLIDMAKSRLGWRMRHIHFGLDEILAAELLVSLKNERRQHRCQEYKAEHVSLWSTGWVNDLLTEAFSHLSSLESVVIRDFDSTTRHRDGPNKAWTSYGAAMVIRECGINPEDRLHLAQHGSETSKLVNQLWPAVVNSLGRANARPKSLKIYERRGNRLMDAAFHLPDALAGHVLPVLANLRELHLCIRSAPKSAGILPYNTRFLRKFLSHTSNLEELRINSCVDSSRNLRGFHQWLAAPPPSSSPPPSSALDLDLLREFLFLQRDRAALDPPPVALPHLRTLSLGIMIVNPNDIVAMATKLSPTLRRLELWKVTLDLAQDTLSPDIPRRNLCLWKYLFKSLLEVPSLNLSEMMVGSPRQDDQSKQLRGSSSLLFFRQGDPDNVVTSLDYKGARWRDWIKDVSMIFDIHREEFLHKRQEILSQYDGNKPKAERSDEMQKLKGQVEKRIFRVRDDY